VQVVIAFVTSENGFLTIPIIFSNAFFCWVFIHYAMYYTSTHWGLFCLLSLFLVLVSLKPNEVVQCKYVFPIISWWEGRRMWMENKILFLYLWCRLRSGDL
jgi:hypothetical protein